jgi:hypothetical protein
LVRTAVCGCIVAGSALLSAGAAAAQTTSTTPQIPSIPVTGGQTATTTTAATSAADDGDLASTGMAADLLVPAGFVLIGTGAVLQAAARRRPRNAYGLL